MQLEKKQFLKCRLCGMVIQVLDAGNGALPLHCGAEMEVLEAGTVDASKEKHIPVIEEQNDGILVKVGEIPHPMEEKHYIEWIALATDGKLCIKHLKPGDEPSTKFGACCSEGGTVYAYCNLHGLWKADV